VLYAALLWAACSDGVQTPTGPGPGPGPGPGTGEVAVLVGAGDIAVCGSANDDATARLLDGQPGTVFAAGDLAYFQGTAEQFRNCYDPSWGRHRARTRPAPGNHEYESADAGPYFLHFGLIAGTPGLGYYRYRSGAWQVYSLNSNMEASSRGIQIPWLRSELAAQPSECTVAYFHHPRFSSGPHGLSPTVPIVRELWFALYEAGVDIVISAHEHFYERFAPQDPSGRPDPEYGIREFVVGTGGAPLTEPLRRLPNSEAVLVNFGILRVTLAPLSYNWEFLSTDGGAVLDSGSGRCHAARPESQ